MKVSADPNFTLVYKDPFFLNVLISTQFTSVKIREKLLGYMPAILFLRKMKGVGDTQKYKNYAQTLFLTNLIYVVMI